MLNKKPRVPAPVQIPTQLSFLHGFKDYLIAQTVSPHTRNAYLSDLLQCSECSQVSVKLVNLVFLRVKQFAFWICQGRIA